MQISSENKEQIAQDALDITNGIYDNPLYFFTDILGVELWEKQIEILNSVKNNRRTAVRSCNSAGKTWFIARLAMWFISAFPHSVVINTAPTHRQVENQFWRHLRHAHKTSLRSVGGKVLKTQWNVDEDWFALGFSTQDGEGGMEAFQGWHSKFILVIIDEASGVNKRVFEAVEGALAGGSVVRLVLIGNPTRNTGDFADAFKDPLYNKIHIAASDIPNVKAGKEIVPGLATREWVAEMKSKYGVDSDVYRVRVEGEFPLRNSDTLISLDSIEKAMDAERELYGDEEVIGLDPARYGDDPAAFVYRKGNFAKVLEVIDKCDTMSLAGKGKNYLKQFPNAVLRIDIVGLGVGVFDRLKEQSDVAARVQGVNSGASPTDKEGYFNLRAEAWDDTKAWLRDAVLEKHEGFYELAGPKYKITSQGKIQMESKEDMKKRGVKSPNVGDALVLTKSRATEGGVPLILWGRS